MNSRRLILTVYAIVLLAFGVGGGAVFLDLHAQLNQLRQRQQENRQKLAQAEARLREQEQMLQRLKTDPEYVERAVRQKLKYAKPGEYIFRFQD